MFYEVIPASSGAPSRLTYESAKKLASGQIVEIPMRHQKLPGIVVKKVVQPDFKCVKISRILYSTPLPTHLLKTISFIADYYATTESAAAAMILPAGILKTRRKPKNASQSASIATSAPLSISATSAPSQKTEQILKNPENPSKIPEIALNPAQKQALEALKTAQKATKVLFGVTGSGKTNIYLKTTLEALNAKKSTILLVPEIALTGQLVRVFREFFGDKVILIHSKQTELERQRIFENLLDSTEPKVIIGPRSALFAPVKNLGGIIIDEEHESSYYQENPPRYSAIRVASFMAKTLNISCLLGSATPNFCDYFVAKSSNSLITLPEKAKKSAKKADIKIIDFKNRDNFRKNRYFSDALLNAIKFNLAHHRQTLIFHNRRGSAPMTICEHCGNELLCPNCFLPLTLHADTYSLVCHTCNFSEKVPVSCPNCHKPGLIHKGFGTKLLETELNSLFKSAKIRRFDADNKKSESLDVVYDEVKNGDIDIIIGTQTVAKGLDLPYLATVGVVQADAGLSLPDFAAEERTFELLTQVIGRVGRGHLDTAEVFIQTFRPDHPVIAYATAENYEAFATYLEKKRQKGGFPPFKFIAKLEFTAKTEKTVIKKVKNAAQILTSNPALSVSTPMPNFHERTEKGYTWQLVVRATSRKTLTSAISPLEKDAKITLDPPSLL